MSKKILTALAPVAAIVAAMAIPAAAQATTVQAPEGTALAVGAELKWQSSNQVIQTSAGNLSCTGSTYKGVVTSNGGETVTGDITSDTFTGCTGPLGVTVDIKTNASAASPWAWQRQQPEHQGTGGSQHNQFTDHLHPAPSKKIQFTVQPQVFGFSTTTCTYGATSIQQMGEVLPPIVVTGTNHFTRESGSSEQCGTPGTLEASFSLTSGGNTVSGDMT